MKFDNCTKVLEIVIRMRDKNRERSENRAVLNRLFNGEPPYNEATAEENGIEINRNFLKGVQVLADARRQWNQAIMSSSNYFTVALDSGPLHKRDGWAQQITREMNKRLKSSRAMMEQVRGTGANTVLHGIAPVTWKPESPFPSVLPIDALLIPTDTDIDFDNMTHFAIRREYTPAALVTMTSGERVDPGWNMELVRSAIKETTEATFRASDAYDELSPERMAEAIKQDAGFYESDAVATIVAWDFYFREGEDGDGWHRRIILDKYSGDRGSEKFLYTSGSRKYCDSLSEILHCQFGDCSAVAPFKYHSVRSLGWLLWGVCDLMNRLECRFYESTFEQLMWFFRTAGENDFLRLRKASFHHLGIIPNGISFLSPSDRFTPDHNIVNMARGSLRSQIAETSASYTQDFDRGNSGKELTATETMARVNSVNALVAGMMTLSYNYEEFKYTEIARRFALGKHVATKAFRNACMADHAIPAEMMEHERWIIKAERVIGAGNKTVEMAAVTFLQNVMRKNLGPQAQRKIDNISIRSVTEQPDLANDLAPLDETKVISNSAHDAELASERLLRGLPFSIRPNMIAEDYVTVWLKDLALTVERALATNSGDQDLLNGIQNMAAHINGFLEQMNANEEERPKVRQLSDALGQVMNHVKGIAQRIQEQQQAQGGDPELSSKLQSDAVISQAKAANLRESHALKTAQRQAQFELEEQRKDRQHEADLRRTEQTAQVELGNTIAAAQVDSQIKQQTKPKEE